MVVIVIHQSCNRRTVHNHHRKRNPPENAACENCTVKGVAHHFHLGINGYVTTVHYISVSECQWPKTIQGEMNSGAHQAAV